VTYNARKECETPTYSLAKNRATTMPTKWGDQLGCYTSHNDANQPHISKKGPYSISRKKGFRIFFFLLASFFSNQNEVMLFVLRVLYVKEAKSDTYDCYKTTLMS